MSNINASKCQRCKWLPRDVGLNLLAPLRSPSLEFSNAALVISLKAEVNTPDAANPPRKDCDNKRYKIILCDLPQPTIKK